MRSRLLVRPYARGDPLTVSVTRRAPSLTTTNDPKRSRMYARLARAIWHLRTSWRFPPNLAWSPPRSKPSIATLSPSRTSSAITRVSSRSCCQSSRHDRCSGCDPLRAMRILVHDYAGHPFQAQLSRELARRGHRVVHAYRAKVGGRSGALERLPTDPGELTFKPIVLGPRASNGRGVPRLLRHELGYGRAASSVIGTLQAAGRHLVEHATAGPAASCCVRRIDARAASCTGCRISSAPRSRAGFGAGSVPLAPRRPPWCVGWSAGRWSARTGWSP